MSDCGKQKRLVQPGQRSIALGPKVLLRCACCHSTERQHTARVLRPAQPQTRLRTINPECQPNRGQTHELRAARKRIRELETELVIIRQAAKFLGENEPHPKGFTR